MGSLSIFECPHCGECFASEDWNEHNKLAILTFEFSPLPEGVEDESRYDCPACDEVSYGSDMLEV